MSFKKYTIADISEIAKETIVIKVVPQDSKDIISFFPGQHTYIKNPSFRPDEQHIFSIANAPQKRDACLEYCIKLYGDWTKNLSKKKKGEELFIDGPFGKFVYNIAQGTDAVFLVGGVGIAPIMSILRSIHHQKIQGNFLLLYGSRTEEYIAYRKELAILENSIQFLRVQHILSDVSPDMWKGYTGFLTKGILQKEVNFSNSPVFFIIGPPIFIQKTTNLLYKFSVHPNKIKTEKVT